MSLSRADANRIRQHRQYSATLSHELQKNFLDSPLQLQNWKKMCLIINASARRQDFFQLSAPQFARSIIQHPLQCHIRRQQNAVVIKGKKTAGKTVQDLIHRREVYSFSARGS